jgi:exoribonuclease-2
MIPLNLSAGAMSLGRGDDGTPALSFGCVLASSMEDNDGALGKLVVDDLVVCPSVVRVKRLTFEDVDRALGQSEENHEVDNTVDSEATSLLCQLSEVATQRQAWRLSQGASPHSLPDCNIKAARNASEPSGWSVARSKSGAREDSIARVLVTELMLLAGEAAAKLAESGGFELPFRTQEVPRLWGLEDVVEAEAELDAIPDGYAKTWRAIRGMSAARLGTALGPHFGLGLDAYVQVNPPLYERVATLHNSGDNSPQTSRHFAGFLRVGPWRVAST